MFESLADVFRQIGHDERVHKEESLAQMKGAGSSRTASGVPLTSTCRDAAPAEGFAVASGFFAPNRVAPAGLSRHDRVFVRASMTWRYECDGVS